MATQTHSFGLYDGVHSLFLEVPMDRRTGCVAGEVGLERAMEAYTMLSWGRQEISRQQETVAAIKQQLQPECPTHTISFHTSASLASL